MRGLSCVECSESCFYNGRILEPDGLIPSKDPSILRDYLPYIVLEKSSTTAVPEFCEHRLSRRLLYSCGHYRNWMNVAAEFPLSDAEIMSSSQPILLFNYLMFILVSCLETEWVSKWKHGFQRIDEALLSGEFSNDHMRKTTNTIIRELVLNRF